MSKTNEIVKKGLIEWLKKADLAKFAGKKHNFRVNGDIVCTLDLTAMPTVSETDL